MTRTVINGLDENGRRISSMEFEKMVRAAASSSANIHLNSYGQHNIGIRLEHKEGLNITVEGPSGQRLGCMGLPGTKIVCKGATSDDVGYLNIGAEITVLGDATNGACNAMAMGKVYIGGSIGARGLTMTKWNPEYEKPELWVLGSTGDSFAEFNCGGIAVVCGIKPKTPKNILGYRPCVGMVGGSIYFRGPIDDSYSRLNAKLCKLDDQQWQWLLENMPTFLGNIQREDLSEELTIREDWHVLSSITTQERALMWAGPMPMAEFRREHWDKTFGGDPLRDIAPGLDRSPINAITTGELRRKKPYWANNEYSAPCTYYCPIHIPTVERLRLLREGRADEAYELLLRYTPLPASVCGAICPNQCIQNCSRKGVDEAIDTQILGRAAGHFPAPKPAAATGKRVAIIGGGPGGMNAAWQLALKGIEAHIFEQDDKLGGKLAGVIPWERLPQATWQYEIDRFTSMEGIELHLNTTMTKGKFAELQRDYDYVIVAVGTHEPRSIPFPGHEKVIPALHFLKDAKNASHPPQVGREVVIIGAGNVGCDVACEAYRLGAEKVTLIDIQKPLAFGNEKEAAEALGAQFRWPITTKEVTDQGIITTDGELIPAQTVIVSIGDVPALSFLPDSVETMTVGGADWVTTNEAYVTSNKKVLAVGDVKRPGLATNALGAGKDAAEYILATEKGEKWEPFSKPLIAQSALTITHYAPIAKEATEANQADRCLSCASCRDCHLCETICPEGAISREDLGNGEYRYVSNDDKCIACGFCADTCPCGIWVMNPY
ncbi:FAD-dependent oxidoreductase [Desulfotalea psychrophila]|uniref:Related to glutamate synthase, beta subunit n=1 Tax=Desulfotalea psychrophila (strain LSv54 / DSM 12343) TaxID=177439 RepID=Q6AJX3_DESPS|nr:FAD-dependent oxidoreductase [Desulfotalea psychrophila]CAG37353.1 related to glutamate synthase, beta subunit [Desulfotalea psychrophila LSv54]